MREFLYRVIVILVNLFFPPFAVAMLSGFSMDFAMNCCLLFLAIIPSHIHGFYISFVYFRRRKMVSGSAANLTFQIVLLIIGGEQVRQGRYPGGPKSFVFSDKIINGGYSNATVEQLWQNEKRLSNRSSRRRSGRQRRPSQAQ